MALDCWAQAAARMSQNNIIFAWHGILKKMVARKILYYKYVIRNKPWSLKILESKNQFNFSWTYFLHIECWYLHIYFKLYKVWAFSAKYKTKKYFVAKTDFRHTTISRKYSASKISDIHVHITFKFYFKCDICTLLYII